MSKRCWKKGELHTHTIWSDGASLPEVAIQSYINLGYDFMCLTDHNVFQMKKHGDVREIKWDEGSWPANLTKKEIKRSEALLHEKIETTDVGVRQFTRLKNYNELKKRFNKPGSFVLMPGIEITHIGAPTECGGFNDWHSNVINLPEELLPLPAIDSVDSYRKNYAQYLAAAAKHPSMESMYIMDHPFWRLWDVSPLAAIENPEIQFFEICNNGAEGKEEQPMMTAEKFWDFVLAHRVDRKQQLLYGVASDDAHFYNHERSETFECNHGWVMVDCPNKFTANEIVRRMKQGEFYATCGVFLDDVVFDKATKTLTVKIKQEPGVNYHIDFITTKRDFDRTITMKDYPHSNARFTRRLPVIPDSVGIVRQSTKGIEASYTMQEYDLYVRAIAISDTPYALKHLGYAPQTQRAWTQPF